MSLSAAQLEELDASGRIWLCFGSDGAASIELDDVVFMPIGEQDKWIYFIYGYYIINTNIFMFGFVG